MPFIDSATSLEKAQGWASSVESVARCSKARASMKVRSAGWSPRRALATPRGKSPGNCSFEYFRMHVNRTEYRLSWGRWGYSTPSGSVENPHTAKQHGGRRPWSIKHFSFDENASEGFVLTEQQEMRLGWLRLWAQTTLASAGHLRGDVVRNEILARKESKTGKRSAFA